MNDKQQLAAMGEHMAEQAAQPLCMAKRTEELEAQVRAMAELLREAKPYMDHRGGAGVKGYTKLTRVSMSPWLASCQTILLTSAIWSRRKAGSWCRLSRPER